MMVVRSEKQWKEGGVREEFWDWTHNGLNLDDLRGRLS